MANLFHRLNGYKRTHRPIMRNLTRTHNKQTIMGNSLMAIHKQATMHPTMTFTQTITAGRRRTIAAQ